MDANKSTIKNLILSKLNRKLILISIILTLIASLFGIIYIYLITIPSYPDYKYFDQETLLKIIIIITIFIITIEAIIISFLISKYVTKPLKILYKTAKEIEKGNYNIKIKIDTNDEIANLVNTMNKTSSTLLKIENERKEIDNTKTEFLNIVSHELRSPITPMKAQLQILIDEYFGPLNEKQKQSLEIITRNTDRLNKTIIDFQELSRIENAKLKFNFIETDVEKIIKEAVQFWEAYTKEKNIEIITKIEKIPLIKTDQDRINQVLRNLINNAIKFSYDNSKIEIYAKIDGDNLLFSIKDNGYGISSEDQTRIFEPFYQVKNNDIKKQIGTGLGLTICRGIIESQKGKIWVESELGKGSIFYFTLPLNPTQEIESIKILFSPKETIEKKIKKEFKTILGPLGEAEFNDLKIKNTLQKEDIFKYINSLININIIPEETGLDFKNKIDEIFIK